MKISPFLILLLVSSVGLAGLSPNVVSSSPVGYAWVNAGSYNGNDIYSGTDYTFDITVNPTGDRLGDAEGEYNKDYWLGELQIAYLSADTEDIGGGASSETSGANCIQSVVYTNAGVVVAPIKGMLACTISVEKDTNPPAVDGEQTVQVHMEFGPVDIYFDYDHENEGVISFRVYVSGVLYQDETQVMDELGDSHYINFYDTLILNLAPEASVDAGYSVNLNTGDLNVGCNISIVVTDN